MQQTDLILSPEEAFYEETVLKKAASAAGVNFHDITDFRIERKSVDARKKQILINMRIALFLKGEKTENISKSYQYGDVSNKPSVVVVGTGPAGLFAALRLIELGFKPIVLERGKNVTDRKRDIAALNTKQILDEDSNYCFGEGGAGTFSDGKLYTRSDKRGNISRILEIFYLHGAADNILYEARPHIGTDKLPKIVSNIRQRILDSGGEVHFSTRLDDIRVEGDKITAVVTSKGNEIPTSAVILATGHSAEDVYRMLQRHGVRLEAKGFAMGVRVEHPQSLINRLMYHLTGAADLIRYLGNASYSLVTQVEGRGVYSFCMCPGGHMVPATSSSDACVVNGMSASHRNSPYANSGIVVQINPEDIPLICQHEVINTQSPAELTNSEALAGLRLQEYVEHLAFEHGGAPAIAPAQRLADFVRGKRSADLPACSYLPGTRSSALHEWMPPFIADRLRQGFRDFDRKYPGFLTNDALIFATESRSSSAVRIPRDSETLQSISHPNLYPCGEGAGYAGGITSSALDGINAALRIASIDD